MLVEQQACSWPEINWSDELNDCYQTNPVAKILPLLSLLAAETKSHTEVTMPLSKGTSMVIKQLGG